MSEQGICPRQELIEMIEAGLISIPNFRTALAQPCSLDLPLGARTTCIRASFLPEQGESIPDTLERLTIYPFELSTQRKHTLMLLQIYANQMGIATNLPRGFRGEMNPKSSTGRGDLMCRVFVDGESKFDTVGANGVRQFYMEMVPLSNNTQIQQETALAQLRIGFGNTLMDEAELRIMYAKTPLLHDYDGTPIPRDEVRFRNHGIEMTADLTSNIVGYRKRKNSSRDYDISAPAGALADQKDEFWEEIPRPANGELILEPGEFYLLSTKEGIRFPTTLCGTLEPYDVSSGEIRAHYAGFFDAGFGFGAEGELPAAHATLEVRAHHVPFRLRDGQPICFMRFHRMRRVPLDEKKNIAVYGAGIFENSSNYRLQRGPTLPKQFLRAV